MVLLHKFSLIFKLFFREPNAILLPYFLQVKVCKRNARYWDPQHISYAFATLHCPN